MVNYNAFNVDPNQYSNASIGNALGAYQAAGQQGIARDRNAIAREGQAQQANQFNISREDRLDEQGYERKKAEEERKRALFSMGLDWADAGKDVTQKNERLGMFSKKFGVEFNDVKFTEAGPDSRVINMNAEGQGPLKITAQPNKLGSVIAIKNNPNLSDEQKMTAISKIAKIEPGEAQGYKDLDLGDKYLRTFDNGAKEIIPKSKTNAEPDALDKYRAEVQTNMLADKDISVTKDGKYVKTVMQDGYPTEVPAGRDAAEIKRYANQLHSVILAYLGEKGWDKTKYYQAQFEVMTSLDEEKKRRLAEESAKLKKKMVEPAKPAPATVEPLGGFTGGEHPISRAINTGYSNALSGFSDWNTRRKAAAERIRNR